MNWFQKIAGGSYSGTLYHGSNRRFESFDLSFAGARDWGDFGIGIYMSNNPNLAISYAYEAVKHNGGGDPLVYKVRANLRNVANFDELMGAIREVEVPEKKDTSIVGPKGLQTRPEKDSRMITQNMVEKGFDAARVNTEFVVYDPSLLQIERVVSADEASFFPALH